MTAIVQDKNNGVYASFEKGVSNIGPENMLKLTDAAASIAQHFSESQKIFLVRLHLRITGTVLAITKVPKKTKKLLSVFNDLWSGRTKGLYRDSVRVTKAVSGALSGWGLVVFLFVASAPLRATCQVGCLLSEVADLTVSLKDWQKLASLKDVDEKDLAFSKKYCLHRIAKNVLKIALLTLGLVAFALGLYFASLPFTLLAVTVTVLSVRKDYLEAANEKKPISFEHSDSPLAESPC